MELFLSLKNSVLLPKKNALFRLNRVSMRNVLVYILLLSLLLVVANMISGINNSAGNRNGAQESMYLLQLIVVYPFFIIFLMITGISLLAAMSFLIKRLLARKLSYVYLWKMTAFALTVPLFIYMVLDSINVDDGFIQLISFLYFLFIMVRIILVYPRKKEPVR